MPFARFFARMFVIVSTVIAATETHEVTGNMVLAGIVGTAIFAFCILAIRWVFTNPRRLWVLFGLFLVGDSIAGAVVGAHKVSHNAVLAGIVGVIVLALWIWLGRWAYQRYWPRAVSYVAAGGQGAATVTSGQLETR